MLIWRVLYWIDLKNAFIFLNFINTPVPSGFILNVYFLVIILIFMLYAYMSKSTLVSHFINTP